MVMILLGILRINTTIFMDAIWMERRCFDFRRTTRYRRGSGGSYFRTFHGSEYRFQSCYHGRYSYFGGMWMCSGGGGGGCSMEE